MPPTKCASATCDMAMHQCVLSFAQPGTTCNDGGGTVCDGQGDCVPTHCTDNTKDVDETDTDCGGPSCGPCANTKACMQPTDCKSGDCLSLVCTACGIDTDCATTEFCDTLNAGGTCAPKKPGGQLCGGDDQCTTNACADGICCDMACNGTCEGCLMSLTGIADGTCSAIIPGTPAPPGQCPIAPPCGADGNCDQGGNCEVTDTGVNCAPPGCSGSLFTAAGLCDGEGDCIEPQPMQCPNAFSCQSNMTCNMSCAGDGACENGFFCVNPGPTGTCAAMGNGGTSCTANDQCSSMLCGTVGMGHCCAAACTTGGMCGAIDCDGAGLCIYPTNQMPCGAPSCMGNMFTPPGACDGAGGCATNPGPCMGGYACNTAGTLCNTTCAADGDCDLAHYCFMMSSMCLPRGGPGQDCNANDQCVSNVCLATHICG